MAYRTKKIVPKPIFPSFPFYKQLTFNTLRIYTHSQQLLYII